MSARRVQSVIASIRPTSRVEWLIVIAILVILLALVVPSAKWASSGTIEIPVHVVVFDASDATPIANALVAIVRAPPGSGEYSLDEYRDRLSPDLLVMRDGIDHHETGTDGAATIECRFPTGASHLHPEARAHIHWYWVMVSAEGFGAVVTPLRYNSRTTMSLREQSEIPFVVGLTAPKALTE